MQEMQVQSLGWEDCLEEEKATHSSIPGWRIPERSPMGHILWDSKESDTGEHKCMQIPTEFLLYKALCSESNPSEAI